MKAYIRTFGCQMNEYDSERIRYFLNKKGYLQAESADKSDIIILNTCAVREKARTRLYGHIGNLKELKKKNPALLICIGGCMAQSLKGKLQKDFPYVDIVFGTHNIPELPSLIDKRIKGKRGVCSIKEEGCCYDPGLSLSLSNFRALIPVSIGCNNFCSYCIVPYVRGREISIDPDLIIKNIKKMVERGILEVMLLGQNVNSYGKDLGPGIDFCRLLDRVSCIEGLRRIRFMTSHPKDFSSELIEIISSRQNIMNHIHLPLQAGSDKILKKMNRKYTCAQYFSIIDEIHKKIPDCSITTDIIVGFPGEYREDFEQTLYMLEKVKFNRAFTFIYSPRKGTGAGILDDPVPADEKKKWFHELLELQNNISLEKNEGFTGKMFEVLIEGTSKKGKDILEGRMENNTIVNFKGKRSLTGKIKSVFIEKARTFYLMGKLTGK